MASIGTPFSPSARKVLLCGSGELGKEVVIELQRYGVEVIACDAYPNAPAMQVADRAHVFSMLDGTHSEGQIAVAVAEEFEIGLDQAKADVSLFLGELRRNAMLVDEAQAGAITEETR